MADAARWVGLRLFPVLHASRLRCAGGFDECLFASEEVALSLALKRQGPFTILRDTVLTSGRKFRTYTVREMLERLVRLAWAGTGALGDRRLLDFWYAPRRKDSP